MSKHCTQSSSILFRVTWEPKCQEGAHEVLRCMWGAYAAEVLSTVDAAMCKPETFSGNWQSSVDKYTQKIRTKNPKHHSPQIPQPTDITRDKHSIPFLTTRFKANQHSLTFSSGLRGVERKGLGVTIPEVNSQTHSCHESPVLSEYLPAVLQHLPPQEAISSHPPSHMDGDARRWPEDSAGCLHSYIQEMPPLFLSHTSNLMFHWRQGGRAASPGASSSPVCYTLPSSWEPHELFQDTCALWGNTNVVLMLQWCSRETEALPCFTAQSSLPSLNRFSNASQVFG